MLVTQSCLTLCDPMDWSPPGSSVHEIFQARVLEWVAISFSKGSSQPRDWTQVPCTASRFFIDLATREAPTANNQKLINNIGQFRHILYVVYIVYCVPTVIYRKEDVVKKIIRKIKYIYSTTPSFSGFSGGTSQNLPANAGDIRDAGSVPGSGRSPGGGHSNPLQYSCLENPMDRGAWRATVHRVAQSQIRLKRLSMHTPCLSIL